MAEVYYDGIDQNCINGDEFDQDGDGDLVEAIDCAGNIQSTCDFDGDGVDDFVGGTDCDDTSSGLNGLDLDTDGFTSCADANGLSDCDDSDANTYPGIAVNESSYDASDPAHTSVQQMLTAIYAAAPVYGCYTIEMTDSWEQLEWKCARRLWKWDGYFLPMKLVNGFTLQKLKPLRTVQLQDW